MPVSISGAGSISGLDQGFNVTTGSVGVGTTNPRTDLQVGAFGGGDSNIQLATGTSGASNILFGDGSAGSDYYKGFIKYNHSTDNLELNSTDDIIHYTSGTERLRISSNGTTTVGPQYDQVKIEPGNGTYDTEATTLSVDGRTNDGNRVALKVDRYDSGTSATTKFSVKYDGTIFSTSGMQAASVNLQSSSTASWFQTGANYGGTNYVWAAKDSSANVWHSGLQTDGDLLLGGNITGTSYIKLNGSTGNATFIGKVDIGSSYTGGEIFKLGKSSGTSYAGYYNGGTAHGFIGHADQLVTGGSATDFAIRSTNELLFATDGSNERLRITSDGELLLSNSTNKFLSFDRTNASSGSGEFNLNVESNSQATVSYDDGAQIVIGTSSSPRTQAGFSEKLRISSSGKVGINYNNPSYMLEVHNPNPGNDSKQLIQRWVNTSQNTLELHMYGGTVDQCQFATTNSEQTLSFLTGVASGNVDSTHTSLLLTQNRDAWFKGPDASNYGGALFIGAEASPYGHLCALRDNNRRPMIYMGGAYPEITLAHTIASNSNHGPTIRFATYVQSTNTPTGNQFVIGTNGSGTFLDIGHAVAAQNQNVHSGIASYNGTYRFRVTTSGCQVNGSLSKSSGSFRIDHPLAGLSTTRDLVHSFIEGPQADLIYRGVVDLVDGTATVNIDTAGRMTEGTFEVLCTNVSCFTSNETDWTAVKGSVSGNILTITAQDNTSTATVSWMVVGERKDPHMIDTDWTDENGRVITEPLKSS